MKINKTDTSSLHASVEIPHKAQCVMLRNSLLRISKRTLRLFSRLYDKNVREACAFQS